MMRALSAQLYQKKKQCKQVSNECSPYLKSNARHKTGIHNISKYYNICTFLFGKNARHNYSMHDISKPQDRPQNKNKKADLNFQSLPSSHVNM